MSGALKIIAAIEYPPVIVKILSHLGLPTRAPARRVDLVPNDLRSRNTQIFLYPPKYTKHTKIHSSVQLLFLFFRIRERLFENCQHRLHVRPFDPAVDVEIVDSRGAAVLRLYVVFRNIDAQ